MCSMSRRGNCHDNAVAESFFQLLKRERVRDGTLRKPGGSEAGRVFRYIEMFYNPKRRHGNNDRQSPANHEQRYLERLESV